MATIVLDPNRVERVFLDCLFRDGEDKTNHVVAEGITSTIGFNSDRLEVHRAEIETLLDELPDEFKASASGGGGWSFLSACNDKHGNQWTDLHQRMEQLFQLGIAIDKVKLLVPRSMWQDLPGGMPYYLVK